MSWSLNQIKKEVDNYPERFSPNVLFRPLFQEFILPNICYIGGRANNGFDEKYKIMLKYFAKFRHSKLKTGIFINKNLTHEQENLILCNSKVCLNIHDYYQRTLITSDDKLEPSENSI